MAPSEESRLRVLRIVKGRPTMATLLQLSPVDLAAWSWLLRAGYTRVRTSDADDPEDRLILTDIGAQHLADLEINIKPPGDPS